jgi:thiamine phosphate synthase YjbQ (UPF0047 family)
VEKVLQKSRIKEEMILVSAMHITAGVCINDDEPRIIKDIEVWLEELASECYSRRQDCLLKKIRESDFEL